MHRTRRPPCWRPRPRPRPAGRARPGLAEQDDPDHRAVHAGRLVGHHRPRDLGSRSPEALKQTVIVENKPGANGNTGTDFVAKSPPDGYTLLLCDVGALAITSSVYTKLPFDPAKDLRGVTMLAYSPHLLVVHPSVTANNLKELVALSKTGKLDFAVTAIGSAPHLAGVAVEKATGAQVGIHPVQGRLAGDRRHRRRPDAGADERHAGDAAVRAVRQAQGARRLEGDARAAAARRADDRRAGRARLRVGHLARRCWCRPERRPTSSRASSAELTRIIRSPDIRARLTAQGAEVYTMTPAEFVDLLRPRAEALGRGRRRRRRQARLSTTTSTGPR